MTPLAPSGPGRSQGRRKRSEGPAVVEVDETPVVVGAVIRWRGVGEAMTSLAASLLDTGGGLPNRFIELMRGLVLPLAMLEDLSRAATASLSGEEVAMRNFASTLAKAAAAVGLTGESLSAEVAAGDDWCYHRSRIHSPTASDAMEAHLSSAGVNADGLDIGAEGIFDDRSLTTLLAASASIALTPQAGGRISVDLALDTILTLVADATVVASVVRGHREAGVEGAFDSLVAAGWAGQLSWLAATDSEPGVMRTMSGGALGIPPMAGGLPGGPIGPGDLGLPDLPGLPGRPGGPPPGDGLGDLIAGFLKLFKKPRPWDIDLIDHKYPWWQNHPEYIDPLEIEAIRCLLAANRVLRALAEPPPTPPANPVWSNGISSVTLSGPCAGATLTIRGTGFGATQPPNTVLLLPTLDGCRPVVPSSWSNTRIEAVLPVRVASGPVGFGDAAYIAAYDAWAARMNVLEQELARLNCSPRPIRFVPPFSRCPPSSTINAITAGVPELVAFTANDETVHLLAHGKPLTLRWRVRNASTTIVQRISASGPLFAGSTTLTPTSSAHAFGPINHVTPEHWQYRVTVTGPCGPPLSRTVSVIPVKQPGLRISQIQVTQSIQTSDHSVKLVADKPTVVRVLVEHGLGTWGGGVVPSVMGRIRMWRGGWSPWVDAANNTKPMQPSAGASITVPVLPSLNNTNDTLNFILPTQWCSGNPYYEVEVRVAGYGAAGPFSGYSDRVVRRSVPVAYQDRRVLHLRYIRVNWNGAGAPSATVCEDTLRSAVPLLPTPTVGVLPLAGQGIHNHSSTAANVNAERRAMLDDFDDLHNCSTWEALTEWLGSDCPDEDGTIWVLIPGDFQQGEAALAPSNVCYTPPSNGPYAAHELSHCLGQQHVRLPTTGGNAPTGGDAATAWPNNGMLVDVPFDPRGSYSSTPGSGSPTSPRALSLAGTGVADVMTYWGTPNNTWPMPKRWDYLWNVIGS